MHTFYIFFVRPVLNNFGWLWIYYTERIILRGKVRQKSQQKYNDWYLVKYKSNKHNFF